MNGKPQKARREYLLQKEKEYKDIDALFKESFKEIEQQPVYSYACND